jgi:hypothetical protein
MYILATPDHFQSNFSFFGEPIPLPSCKKSRDDLPFFSFDVFPNYHFALAQHPLVLLVILLVLVLRLVRRRRVLHPLLNPLYAVPELLDDAVHLLAEDLFPVGVEYGG